MTLLCPLLPTLVTEVCLQGTHSSHLVSTRYQVQGENPTHRTDRASGGRGRTFTVLLFPLHGREPIFPFILNLASGPSNSRRSSGSVRQRSFCEKHSKQRPLVSPRRHTHTRARLSSHLCIFYLFIFHPSAHRFIYRPPHIYLSSLYSPFLLPPTHLLIHRSTFPSSVDFDFRSEKLNGSCALTHLWEFSNTLRLSRQTVSWIWLKGLKSG